MSAALPTIPSDASAATQADADGDVGSGEAHAKAILFGEHAVVYGEPALALPVRTLRAVASIRRIRSGFHLDSDLFTGPFEAAPTHIAPVITALHSSLSHTGLQTGASLRLRSNIPHGRGLGSSAAVAAAIARATAELTGQPINSEGSHQIIQSAEKVAHGNPSGLDARAVASTGIIRFHQSKITNIAVGAPQTFVIADSGVVASTANAVALVREQLTADPARIRPVISRLGRLSDEASEQLIQADAFELGKGMDEAQQLLASLGLSHPRLEALIAASKEAGALGAKLTGGGMGGCVIILAESPEHAAAIIEALTTAQAFYTWMTRIDAT